MQFRAHKVVSITKIDRLPLCMEIVATYCETYIKHKNTHRAAKRRFSLLEQVALKPKPLNINSVLQLP